MPCNGMNLSTSEDRVTTQHGQHFALGTTFAPSLPALRCCTADTAINPHHIYLPNVQGLRRKESESDIIKIIRLQKPRYGISQKCVGHEIEQAPGMLLASRQRKTTSGTRLVGKHTSVLARTHRVP